MPAAYIREQGSYIRLKNGKIAVTKEKNTIMEIPLFLLENVSVFGSVQISTQAMTKFLQSGINVSFFTRSGKYIGQTCSGEGKNIRPPRKLKSRFEINNTANQIQSQ